LRLWCGAYIGHQDTMQRLAGLDRGILAIVPSSFSDDQCLK